MARHDPATAANETFYANQGLDYLNAAPHLKHVSLRVLHDQLVADIYRISAAGSRIPAVLDLGAGEGTSSEAFLKLGAKVTAVDLSSTQLRKLQARCTGAGARLDVICDDAWAVLKRPASFDVVVLNSFLHHVPDYLGLISEAIKCLEPGGQLFSFQDPLRYDTVARATYTFANASYFGWRIFQGDLVRGLKTRLRRLRGIHVAGSEEDDAEYHVTRNGVDQLAIVELMRSAGFDVRVVRYFSTQSSIMQRIGSLARLENTFGILAQRR